MTLLVIQNVCSQLLTLDVATLFMYYKNETSLDQPSYAVTVPVLLPFSCHFSLQIYHS